MNDLRGEGRLAWPRVTEKIARSSSLDPRSRTATIAGASPRPTTERKRTIRVAIYGGSFDPVHLGHVALAAALRNAATLAEVIFVPAGSPPHKLERRLAPGEDRLRMLELALEGRVGLGLDDRELRRSGPSYTFDTMKEIRAERPQDELYFLVGMDSLELLPRWHRSDELAELCRFLVVARPGFDDDLVARARALQPKLELEVVATPEFDLSSTEVRAALARDDDAAELIDPRVRAYIRERGLYR